MNYIVHIMTDRPTAATTGLASKPTLRARTLASFRGLHVRLSRYQLVIDQVLVVGFTLVHIALCLAWINFFLPSFAVYTQDFSYSWFLLALTALHPGPPIATAYALKQIASNDTRKWFALLVGVVFVLLDVFILANGLILRFLYCPNDMNPPICTPTASLEALLYFHLGFFVGDFVLIALVHKLRRDARMYNLSPLQTRVNRY